MSSDHEVLAVRYGYRHSPSSESYLRYETYGRPDGTMQTDYFFWVVRNHVSGEVIVVDTGYDPDAMQARPGRTTLVHPADALRGLNIAPEEVGMVIVSHMHWDHIGNVSSFPSARVVVQRKELEFWVGPVGTSPPIAASAEAAQISHLRDVVDQGRAVLLDGDRELAPGVQAQLVGGHCPGQQIVVVDGTVPVVLASDAAHFYREMDEDMPFRIYSDLQQMYDAYGVLRELRDLDGAIVVPGHDPLVLERFEAIENDTVQAVRIA